MFCRVRNCGDTRNEGCGFPVLRVGIEDSASGGQERNPTLKLGRAKHNACVPTRLRKRFNHPKQKRLSIQPRKSGFLSAHPS